MIPSLACKADVLSGRGAVRSYTPPIRLPATVWQARHERSPGDPHMSDARHGRTPWGWSSAPTLDRCDWGRALSVPKHMWPPLYCQRGKPAPHRLQKDHFCCTGFHRKRRFSIVHEKIREPIPVCHHSGRSQLREHQERSPSRWYRAEPAGNRPHLPKPLKAPLSQGDTYR